MSAAPTPADDTIRMVRVPRADRDVPSLRALLPIRFLPPRPKARSATTEVVLGRPRPSRVREIEPAPAPLAEWARALPWRFFFVAFFVSATCSFALERYYAYEVRSHACGAR